MILNLHFSGELGQLEELTEEVAEKSKKLKNGN